MLKINLCIDRESNVPIAEQIVGALRLYIESKNITADEPLPSIRQLAADSGVSRNAVIEAYDQLVALGLLRSRPGSGFYVAAHGSQHWVGQGSSNPQLAGDVADQMWSLFNDSDNLKLGCGWLPEGWRETDDLTRAMRQVMRLSRTGILEYSTPLGLSSLRQLIQTRLQPMDIDANMNQILLTTGASHALDLLVRNLTRPGDTVFVESPGYYNLFGLLKLQGVNMIGVPRGPDGPDIGEFERLLSLHRPKLFFINSVLQNPTGTTLSPGTAHSVLKLADRFDFNVIEDDIYADFQDERSVRLAALDGLRRVIYVGSYSKTLSCSLRVGFIAADPVLIKSLVDVKMLTSIASSRFCERVVATMLENGSYRKMLDRLRHRMSSQSVQVQGLMEKAGWELFSKPTGGMFVWARRPESESMAELMARATQSGVSLTPGSIFRPDGTDTPWLRINVTYANDPRARSFLTQWPLDPPASTKTNGAEYSSA